MVILNLYAGLGGNRSLWRDVEVVAVENCSKIASIYQDRFPQDKVVIDDAHHYLFEHYRKFDFIWSSPPCQTHSDIRQNLGVRNGKTKPTYIDINLWQEIIFLKHNASCKWVVENVNPYYKPLVSPSAKLGRHLFWSNFKLEDQQFDSGSMRYSKITDWEKRHQINLSHYEIGNKRQLLRNCVAPEIGLSVLKAGVVSIKKGDLIRSGMARAKANGKCISRPRLEDDVRDQIVLLKKKGLSNRKIAQEIGVHHQTVANTLRRKK